MPYGLPDNAFSQPKIGYKFGYIEAGILSLAINLLSLVLPLFTLQVYDRLMSGQNEATLYILTLSVIVVISLEVFLRLCRSHLMGASSAAFEYSLSSNTIRHTLEQSTTNNRNVGEFLSCLQAATKLKDISSAQMMNTLVDLPFIFVYLALISYLGGIIVIVPILLLSIMSIKALILSHRLKKTVIQHEASLDDRYDFLINILNQIHTIKSYGLEDAFSSRFEHWQKECTKDQLNVSKKNNAAYNQGLFFSHSMMISVAVFGGHLVISGQITLGVLIACVLLSGRVMQPVQKLLGMWSKWHLSKRIKEELRTHFSSETRHAKQHNISDVQRIGKVSLRNVSFHYADHAPLLKNVSIDLEPGDSIALVGEHGAGKNTLLKLIAGMIAPEEGEVLINDEDPYLMDSDELLSHVGYLPFEGIIFKGTIWDNLSRFGRIKEDRIFEISALLGLDEEVGQLPAGYDTQLFGNNTDALSPGLRQRIALVRVLAAKPRVILYYFSEESLDKNGYNAMYDLLAKLKGMATIVIVSNDDNIIGLADQQYFVEDAELVKVEGRDGTDEKLEGYKELKL